MTREPENVYAQLWLAHVHLWGVVLFGAMAATSAAAVLHHLERAGVLPKRLTVEDAIAEAEQALRRER